MSDAQPLERGMLVLAPWKDRHVLWTVTTVGLKSAKMIARFDYGTVEVKTTTATLPDDWRVISNRDASRSESSHNAMMTLRREELEAERDRVAAVAARMASTVRDVLSVVEANPDYPWQGGALKQQMREDLTAYELLAGDLVVLEGNTRDGCDYQTKDARSE